MSANWKTKPLGSVATLQRGFDLPARLRKSGTVPIVTSSGIEDSHYEARVKGPGVVTGRYGTIGQVFFVRDDFWPLNTTLYVRDFHKNNPLFISYLLRTIDFHTHSGKSGVPGVNRNDLHEIVVVLPPTKAEQEAIAEALSDADALIESLEQLLTKKRQLKQGAMQELLTGKTRLPGFEVKPGYKQTEVGQIPEDWEPVPMKTLGTFSKGQGICKGEATSGDIPCVRYGEIYTHHNDIIRTFNSRISAEVAKTSKRLKKGDLLFAGSGETKEEIGKSVAFVGDEEAYAGGDIVILSPSKGNSKFFGYLFNSPIISSQKASKGQGDAVVHISATALSSIKFPLPPTKAEQEAIAAILSDMDTEIAALEAKLAKTRQLKQGMMQELLTGRIRLINEKRADED
ncbi:MAG TPA: restriction endonuclease subunit S [Nitrospiraceae bacterium]|nr:restriction endonuclease subunit S [Nitrospiraceae bacterium]